MSLAKIALHVLNLGMAGCCIRFPNKIKRWHSNWIELKKNFCSIRFEFNCLKFDEVYVLRNLRNYCLFFLCILLVVNKTLSEKSNSSGDKKWWDGRRMQPDFPQNANIKKTCESTQRAPGGFIFRGKGRRWGYILVLTLRHRDDWTMHRKIAIVTPGLIFAQNAFVVSLFSLGGGEGGPCLLWKGVWCLRNGSAIICDFASKIKDFAS